MEKKHLAAVLIVCAAVVTAAAVLRGVLLPAREPPTVFVSETLRARGALSLRLDAEGPPARLGLSIAVGLGRAGALLLAAAGGSGDDGACGLGWRARP